MHANRLYLFFPAVDECSDINFRLGFPEDRAQCVLMSESEAINPAIVQLSTAIAPARTNKKTIFTFAIRPT